MPDILVDVAVIGAGPAGAVLAKEVAEAGYRVALIDKQTIGRGKFGDCIPPEASHLVRNLFSETNLDVRRALARPCRGVARFTHCSTHADRRYFRQARGGDGGWIIDRQRFEKQLVLMALGAGALTIQALEPVVPRRTNRVWHCRFNSLDGSCSVTSRYLVDATGRTANVARRIGAKLTRLSELIALTASLPALPNSVPEPGWIWIETTPYGWWYSALAPNNNLYIALHLVPDRLNELYWLRSGVGFWGLLRQTRATSRRVNDVSKVSTQFAPVPRDAGTTKLAPIVGDAWIAVGDAAISFDPISSQGLFNAMASGKAGGQAIIADMNGTETAIAIYAQKMVATHALYAAELPHFEPHFRAGSSSSTSNTLL